MTIHSSDSNSNKLNIIIVVYTNKPYHWLYVVYANLWQEIVLNTLTYDVDAVL
jgi:hypothetical protein